MSRRPRELADAAMNYAKSYTVHANKIVAEWGEDSDVDAIRGWINDCRGFLEKASQKSNQGMCPRMKESFDDWLGEQLLWLDSVEDQLKRALSEY